jgi:hypothetical protein
MNNYPRFNRTVALSVPLFLLLATAQPFAVDISIKKSTDTTHTATYQVDDNNLDSFDSIMRLHGGPNTNVYIYPDPTGQAYQTRGLWDGSGVLTNWGFRVPSNCKIHGVIETTNWPILRLMAARAATTNDPPENIVVASLAGTDVATNMQVTDLKIDCNAAWLTTNNTTRMRLMDRCYPDSDYITSLSLVAIPGMAVGMV